mgnify:CR=1 FL=1
MADIVEKDKVLPEGERAMAEEAKVEKALTPEEVAAKNKELAEQTRAAGLSLLGMTVQTYFSRLKNLADDALAGLEGSSADAPTKKV